MYQIGRQIGVMSPNEIRELEDMNERTDPGGDSYDNPNTTAGGQPAQPVPADTEGPDKIDKGQDTPTTSNRLHKVITNRLQAMARTETSRVLQAVEKESNFCGWVGERGTR